MDESPSNLSAQEATLYLEVCSSNNRAKKAPSPQQHFPRELRKPLPFLFWWLLHPQQISPHFHLVTKSSCCDREGQRHEPCRRLQSFGAVTPPKTALECLNILPVEQSQQHKQAEWSWGNCHCVWLVFSSYLYPSSWKVPSVCWCTVILGTR